MKYTQWGLIRVVKEDIPSWKGNSFQDNAQIIWKLKST
jgi:hypothetical protein